jgi:spoIIIJ-associated protein
MLDQQDIKKIKETAEEFFQKMTINASRIEVNFSAVKDEPSLIENTNVKLEGFEDSKKNSDAVDLDIKLEEPQILIGEKGQTLFEIQRLLRTILNKKIKKVFYLNLDINDYKKKKIEYLKSLAKDLADEVAFTKEEKVLFPMPAYERRIIHLELSQRQDVVTESKGEEPDRYVVIKPS